MSPSKVPNDSQEVTCAQDELKIKRQMLERVEVTDKRHAEYIAHFEKE